MNIFLLNGPPGCGKDTVGKMLAQMLPGKTVVAKFAEPLKLATHGVIAILNGLKEVEGPDAHENDKDRAQSLLNGFSYRDAYIAMSERFCKPLFGDAYFGNLMAKRIRGLDSDVDHVVITDCGFTSEVDAMVRSMPTASFHLWYIHRTGCSFLGDSRSYIELPDSYLTTRSKIENNDTLGSLRVEVAKSITTIGN